MFSIAQFGSVCRKTNDLYSDHDLLVICEGKKRKYYYDKFTKRGYSVSTFTENQLYNMKRKGSLFLQHLKLESRILVDKNDSLKTFLDDCLLIAPSNIEIDNCRRTIEKLYCWPNDAKSIAWKADFLYGSSRDYLIKILAKHGVFAFGLDNIIAKCSEVFAIELELFQPLILLRCIKSAYRSDIELPDYSAIKKAIDDWFDLLKIKMSFSYNLLNDNEFLIRGEFSSNYERLRYLEIIYVSLVGGGYAHEKHHEIVNYILQPNLYQSLKRCKVKNIEIFFNELYSIYNHTVFYYLNIPLKSNILMQQF